MLTLEQAFQLQFRDVLVAQDGRRWYVNGAVQTWKRDPTRIRVPLKHGLHAYDAITEADFRSVVIGFNDAVMACMELTKEGN